MFRGATECVREADLIGGASPYWLVFGFGVEARLCNDHFIDGAIRHRHVVRRAETAVDRIGMRGEPAQPIVGDIAVHGGGGPSRSQAVIGLPLPRAAVEYMLEIWSSE